MTAELLAVLVDTHQIAMIGPIRQELLFGIKVPAQFKKLRERLRAFPDHPINTPLLSWRPIFSIGAGHEVSTDRLSIS